jgi:hypothetical protein
MPQTVAEVQAEITLYETAQTAILQGQAYTIKDRSLTRANLGTVLKRLKELRALLDNLQRGGIRMRRGVPRDK